MNKLFLSAALVASLLGSALAQDAANKDQPAQAKTDQATPDMKTFSDFQIGMAFDYPSTWVMVADPKQPKGGIAQILGKKQKKKLAAGKQAEGESLFYVPANSHTADLEVYGALFDHAPEEWEKNQTDIATLDKKQVVKQWREEILGVPLLLSKIAFDDAAGHEVTLVGLVYSRTPYKMLFRLTAPDVDYDAAEYQLRQALQTLRTTSGALPVPEDPNHPLDQSAYVNVVNKPPKVLVMSTPSTDMKAKKGEVAVNCAVADAKVVLTMPAGWSADAPAADGSITLHNPAVTGGVTISLASVLDSDPPQSAILKASSVSLDRFTKVDKRDEVQSDFSTAGASTDMIWRHGSNANGPLTTCEACGATGELYWLLRYQLAGMTSPAEMKALSTLIDGMSVDPAP